MRTIIELFENSVSTWPKSVFLWQKKHDRYQGSTYIEVHRQVQLFAAGLMKMGLAPGDRVTLLSEGRKDWVVSELAVLYNGAINVPLSVKLNEPEELKFRLIHSGSKIAIVSQGQLNKIVSISDSLPSLKKIICLDSLKKTQKGIIAMNDILQEGEKFLEKNSEEFQKRILSVKEDDFANICYTSGTTADPKGIILSHRNYTANVEQAASLFDIPSWYTSLLILPWDHSFAHTCGIYAKMKFGASLAAVKTAGTTVETLKNIPVNIREIRPLFLLSVPALAKNFRKNIEKAIEEKGRLISRLFRHALKIAYSYNGTGWDRGRGIRKMLWPLYKLYDLILFHKIRSGFGGRLKFFIGGGALLDIELQKFFYALGIPMLQGYGLTEASPVISSNTLDKHKLGSSGYLVSNLKLKICDDDGNELPRGKKGEIVIQGENVMKGYWNNESATKDVLKGGWLYTGDLGYIDEDGFLYVLGRFKSLLIADDGEKFSPEGIEEAFCEKSVYIDQCMLYNNQKPYSVCFVVPDKEALKKYFLMHNVPESERVEVALKIIEEELNRFRKGGEFDNLFPQRWLPVSIAILPEGFTEENQLMNSTLKMVRPKIIERYSGTIDFLYTPEAKIISNDNNRQTMHKLLN